MSNLRLLLFLSSAFFACSSQSKNENDKKEVKTSPLPLVELVSIVDSSETEDDLNFEEPPKRKQWINDSVHDFTWQQIDTGLFYAEAGTPIHTNFGDNKISVLRINPKYYEFHLESSKEDNSPSKTAAAWAKEKDFIAVFNAGMFQLSGNYASNVGYMKDQGYVNNPKFSNQNF